MTCLGIIISDYQLWWRKGFKTPKASDQRNWLVQLEELPLVSLVARRVVDERPGWFSHRKSKYHHQSCKGECRSEGRLWTLFSLKMKLISYQILLSQFIPEHSSNESFASLKAPPSAESASHESGEHFAGFSFGLHHFNSSFTVSTPKHPIQPVTSCTPLTGSKVSNDYRTVWKSDVLKNKRLIRSPNLRVSDRQMRMSWTRILQWRLDS